jgi:hypothetical protein
MSWRQFFVAELEVERKYWVPIRNFSLPLVVHKNSNLGVVIRDAARPHAGVRQKSSTRRLQQRARKHKSLARNNKTWVRVFG